MRSNFSVDTDALQHPRLRSLLRVAGISPLSVCFLQLPPTALGRTESVGLMMSAWSSPILCTRCVRMRRPNRAQWREGRAKIRAARVPTPTYIDVRRRSGAGWAGGWKYRAWRGGAEAVECVLTLRGDNRPEMHRKVAAESKKPGQLSLTGLQMLGGA